MKFELIAQEYDPANDAYYDWSPKQWDDEKQMWMDSETGLPWCDHEWKNTYHPNSYNAMICDKCGERNY